MSRDFSKLSPEIWRSPRFHSLGNSEAALLWHYYVAGPHANSSGCSRIPDGYAAADFAPFGWTVADLVQHRQELADAQLITFDPATSEVYVDRWFVHNPPTNISHAKGASKIICKIEGEDLRLKVEEEFLQTEWGQKLKQVQDAAANVTSIAPEDRLTATRFMRGGGTR
ncbi:hypothetical protein ABMA32_03670 [Mesorhizobium sp. VNQ89]|uniref:hypothetical protein n=1 Tax=Mesorhizobium quangtriensis TaxID=3157709 RepID=UPI0032B70EC6